MEQDYSEDFILGGRISIRQPLKGYRVAVDPIFLAASVAVNPGENVLDIGTGVGAASLCLAAREPKIKIVGIDIEREYVRLAAHNVSANHMRERIEILQADLCQPPPRLAAGSYAHVMANPPYLEADRAKPSPYALKTAANQEINADLEQWARFCLLMVRPRGTVTFIHRADRLDHILHYFVGKLGNITVYPLWSGLDKPAKRVIIRGIKNSSGPMQLLQGMVLHDRQGRFTPEAENVLRHGYPISLNPQ